MELVRGNAGGYRVLLALVFLLLAPTVTSAQSALDGFDPDANGPVLVLALQPDGKILVGGDFTQLSGQPRNRIARLHPDGSLDTSFDPGAGAGGMDGRVNTLAVQPDGKILVGGRFTMLRGQPRNFIGRLHPDGTLDATFDPGVDSPNHVLIDPLVETLVVQPDGKILVGGQFTILDGQPRNYIGRLHPDGTLDATFDPGAGANDTVVALALQPDGKMVLGGLFTLLGGQPRNYIGRLHANGSLDTTFDPGPGANDTIDALALQPDGRIMVAGDFTQLAGQDRRRVGRLNPDGSLDTLHSPEVAANDRVIALALQADGRILIGGDFTSYDANARGRVARLEFLGGNDSSFHPGTGADDTVLALAVQSDGKILVGGVFTTLDGQPRSRIGRLHADGSLDTGFNPSANGSASALAVQPDGKILVGGGFTQLGGQVRRGIARLHPDGSLDTGFDPNSGNEAVRAVAVQPDGKILVAGNFMTLGGQPRNRIARLNTNGSLDTSFDPDASDDVAALVIQPDGKILVGGFFTLVGGQARNFIARLHPDGSLDGTFDPNADNTVRTLAIQPDGKILVGGDFTMLGGQVRNFIARLHPDGSLDTSFDPDASDDVRTLTVQPDGKILVGGNFTMLGGQVRNRVARLLPDGSLDPSFSPNADNVVSAVAIQPDGKVLIGGVFTQLDGQTRNRIARLQPDGSLDTSFDPDADNTVSTLAVQPDGKVLVGGFFATVGGQTRNRIARLTVPEAAVQSLDVVTDGTGVRWARSGSGPEVAFVTFASSTDGTAYTHLGAGTRVAGAWELMSLNLPSGPLYVRALGVDQRGTSGSLHESVRRVFRGTTTTVLTSSVSPSVAGQPVTFTATVTPSEPALGPPTGSVTFTEGATVLASAVALDAAGQASLITSGLGLGAHTLTATYGGDASFTGSSGMIAHTVQTALTVTIDGHANGDAFAHTSPFLDLTGTSGTSARLADGPAATVTGVTWENDRGGSGSTDGTTTWRAPVIPLQPGANTITIRATDDTGNTVAASVTVTVSQLLYYLAEGATGPFFDFDLLLGNPNAVAAPVTITFLKEDGSTVLFGEILAANSQRTIAVNSIPGLETAAVSTVVSSDSGLPLAVERSMLWDASVPAPRADDVPAIAPGATHYGGHTAKAVDSPQTQWLFAEGSQGFFDTYLLLANANPTPANVTVTYLVESGAPVVQNVVVGATARLTLFAGAVAQLVGTSFGIVVDASQPIIAERAMYFSAGRFWEGGHESAGVPEASTRWFHAEGATGAFFDTFILVSNPNGRPANLAVTYLLASGTAIPKNYVVPANGRITINVETQDAQLVDAAVSTTVTSDVPVISERAMYWVDGFTTWYEAHNSFGVTATGAKWGLAEGRVGTSTGYQTFILLANPTATAAQIRITYLRTSGTTVVKTYTVLPTSRFNVWVNAEVPELIDERFGALIEVTNGVEIAVERALYWDNGTQTWGVGTNATAVRLP